MGLHRYMNDNEIRMIAQIRGPIDYSPAQLSASDLIYVFFSFFFLIHMQSLER